MEMISLSLPVITDDMIKAASFWLADTFDRLEDDGYTVKRIIQIMQEKSPKD